MTMQDLFNTLIYLVSRFKIRQCVNLTLMAWYIILIENEVHRNAVLKATHVRHRYRSVFSPHLSKIKWQEFRPCTIVTNEDQENLAWWL